MIRKTVLLITAAALLTMPACKRDEESRPVPGNKAPQFTLKDTEGKNVSLASFKGKIVLLDFWATWCGPCKDSTPVIAKLHRAYAGRGVVILGISMDEGEGAVDRVKEYAQQYGIPYRLLMDDGNVSKAYRIRTIPATFLLDADHVIEESYPGYLPGLGAKLSVRIEELLTGKREGAK